MNKKNCETNLLVFSENSNTRSPSAEVVRKRIVTVIFGLFYNFFLFLRMEFAGFFSNRVLKITIRNFNFFSDFFRPGAQMKAGLAHCRYRSAGAELSADFIRQPCADTPVCGPFFRTAVKYCLLCFSDRLLFAVKILIFERVYRFCKLFLSVYDHIILSAETWCCAVMYPTLLLFNLNKLL